MTAQHNRSGGGGLARSCAAPGGDWFWTRSPGAGVELLQAWFGGIAYDRHRHDTYSIGLTDSGVQCFSYRGASQASTTGKVIVLHPDELHDGHAGTPRGFRYRMLYIAPARLAEALRSLSPAPATLPFVPEAVSASPILRGAVEDAFDDHDGAPGEPLALDALVLRVAEGLIAGDPCYPRPSSPRRLHHPALERAREWLDQERGRVVRSSELEAITGLSRYDLARQFRARYGTSPYRYLLMRRLAVARDQLAGTASLAEVALAAGFSDQAHFTRRFKAAFGITPARYARLKRPAPRYRA